MNITYNNKTYTIPKPFDKCYFGSNPTKEMTIFNRFSDETFIGCEATEDYDTMQQGLDWFSRNFTKEYMVLLD